MIALRDLLGVHSTQVLEFEIDGGLLVAAQRQKCEGLRGFLTYAQLIEITRGKNLSLFFIT